MKTIQKKRETKNRNKDRIYIKMRITKTKRSIENKNRMHKRTEKIFYTIKTKTKNKNLLEKKTKAINMSRDGIIYMSRDNNNSGRGK